MSNRFIETLPKTYASLKVKLQSTENEARALWFELGEAEDYEYHDCDCEYCPVPEAPELSKAEVEEKTEQAEKLDELVAEYEATIRSVEGYAKLVKVDLAKPTLTKED